MQIGADARVGLLHGAYEVDVVSPEQRSVVEVAVVRHRHPNADSFDSGVACRSCCAPEEKVADHPRSSNVNCTEYAFKETLGAALVAKTNRRSKS